MTSYAQASDDLLPLKRALLALQKMRRQSELWRTKLNALEYAKREPIAIIGMGCRFPGGANDPESFWQLLSRGVDAVREVPAERWDAEAFYDPDTDAPGKMYVREGGFLDHVDRFDAHFFGIAPREAVSLDPQQRLLLEVGWEALENAGIAPDNLLESQTGVYVGLMANDYGQLNPTHLDFDPYIGTGTGISFSAGRLSYLLGLQGPAMTVGTACSSSLVTTHLACQALRAGECDMALSGGVSLMLNPQTLVMLCNMKAIAPDGRCKTFDAKADGYGRGEGCGVLVLKRLSDALADGDRIWAVIRGSAVNHDGPSGGLTVPNGPAQEKVLRQALKNAQLDGTAVDYVEAHGTGTSLGDPIEVRALGKVMGHQRRTPLLISSVKTNIGHLEAAAGVAGIIKVVLSMQHGQIPAHLHLATPNPHIQWDDLPIKVPTELMAWPASKRRIAGVSSFGMSGTNAHLILEEAPAGKKEQGSRVQRSANILCLSAKTEEALRELAERYIEHLERQPALSLADLCFTANTGRAHFDYRLAVVAETVSEARDKLLSMIALQNNHTRSLESPRIAFLFTGQGSQYVGMGQDLYETQPTFRQTIEQCDEILRPYLSFPLLSVLYPTSLRSQPTSLRSQPTNLLNQTQYTQVALFAIEYALAKLWESWGVVPFAVIGHSVGELVAACVAGVFSLEDGLKLVAERGRLMQSTAPGQMVAIFASEASVASVIRGQTCSIAAINGPQLTVIAGTSLACQEIVSHFESKGIRCQPLTVSHAFHSPLMEPILSDFRRVAQQIHYSSPTINLISNVTGAELSTDVTNPEYWVRHIRQPVRFADSMKTLMELGIDTFVEIGPKPTLLAMGRRCLSPPRPLAPHPEARGTSTRNWLPSLRPHHEWPTLLSSACQLYMRGREIDWAGFDKDYVRQKVVLPTYPWRRKRYWITDEKYKRRRAREAEEQMPLSSSELSAEKNHNANESQKPTQNNLTLSQLSTWMQELEQAAQNRGSEIEIEIAEIKGLRIRVTPTSQPKSESSNDFSRSGPRTTEVVTTKRKLTPLASISTEATTPIAAQNGAQAPHAPLKSRSTADSSLTLAECQSLLKSLLAEALYLDDASEVDKRRKFIDQGLDSVIGIEFINAINQALGLQLKAIILYDYPTLIDLSEYVLSELRVARGTSDQEPNPSFQNDLLSVPSEQEQLRSILLQVSKGELNAQSGNKLIEQLKANAAKKPASEELTTKKRLVFGIIKEQMIDIIPELSGKAIEYIDNLDDLGFDSVEQAEILVKTMESLRLNTPRIHFANTHTVGDLVERLGMAIK